LLRMPGTHYETALSKIMRFGYLFLFTKRIALLIIVGTMEA